MNESLLQYIWQFQYYNHAHLNTTKGDMLQIINAGTHNTHQGPDFKNAKIKINETIWAGHIELHVQSSQWQIHKHSTDENFKNIILHVVWKHDAEIIDISGHELPTLELQDRVSKILLEKFTALLAMPQFIPCEHQLPDLTALTIISWKQRLAAERLLQKSEAVFNFLKQNEYHWEETFWWLISNNFGLKVNSGAFLKMAQSLPLSIIAKNKNSLLRIEALLFGQAGLLKKDFKDQYAILLQNEYNFLKKKYRLNLIDEAVFFLRMRPANFPTIRLAQLAQLLYKSEHLFSKIRETKSISEIRKLFALTAIDYWHYHYHFDEEVSYKEKTLGKEMINNILINTVIPLVFTYGLHHQDEVLKERAIEWLEQLPAEKNNITKGYVTLGFANNTALDSQSLLQLKNSYCSEKRCLECSIGNAILKSG
ncbi:MAG: DUF2851 family protein [Bacteroidetes bacterium]|nr:DUF2851 family protein [Bacteroidota bacterium]